MSWSRTEVLLLAAELGGAATTRACGTSWCMRCSGGDLMLRRCAGSIWAQILGREGHGVACSADGGAAGGGVLAWRLALARLL